MADTTDNQTQDEWNEETVYGPSTVIAALDQIEDLVESLTEVFHRPVDLVSRRSLHPMIRDRVMAEAETLYAAA